MHVKFYWTKLGYKLDRFLPRQICNRNGIKAMLPPASVVDLDSLAWNGTHDSKFSVCPVQPMRPSMFLNPTQLLDSSLWKSVWRWQGPHHMKIILRKALNNILPSSNQLFHHLPKSQNPITYVPEYQCSRIQNIVLYILEHQCSWSMFGFCLTIIWT